MPYTFTEGGYRPQTVFCAGLMVPDLAAALAKETGTAWTYQRKESDTPGGFEGHWYCCAVVRVSDGLSIGIRREAYNKPLRGSASINWRESGTGGSYPNTRHECTFAHDRDLKAIARQIIRTVIEPHTEDLARLRQQHKEREGTKARVEMQLQTLARTPGCRINRVGDDQTYVGVGPLTFAVSSHGYVQIRSGSVAVEDLAALAEFFESLKRQHAA